MCLPTDAQTVGTCFIRDSLPGGWAELRRPGTRLRTRAFFRRVREAGGVDCEVRPGESGRGEGPRKAEAPWGLRAGLGAERPSSKWWGEQASIRSELARAAEADSRDG